MEQPSQGDSGLAVAEYAKQQDAHTAAAVAQRHGLMTKQVLAKVSRLVQDVQRQSKALAATLAGFRVDPSAGASKVRALLGFLAENRFMGYSGPQTFSVRVSRLCAGIVGRPSEP